MRERVVGIGSDSAGEEGRRSERVAPAADGDEVPAPRAAETGGDDGDPDLPRQPLVDRRAEDDVRVVGRSARDSSAASLTS
jgi:hypothetical protein